MTICVKCAEEKSEDDFYFNKTYQHRDKTCKKCRRGVANTKARALSPQQVKELNLRKRYGITLTNTTKCWSSKTATVPFARALTRYA